MSENETTNDGPIPVPPDAGSIVSALAAPEDAWDPDAQDAGTTGADGWPAGRRGADPSSPAHGASVRDAFGPGRPNGRPRGSRALGITREQELERQVAELRRANRRLSGALTIVLDTLDSQNVGELFGRVLEEVAGAMDADGTICYLAEPDGFHLRGLTRGLDAVRVAQFMPFGRALESLVTREGHAMRLSVRVPSGRELRRGRLSECEVVDEATGEVTRVQSAYVPPFASFFAVPVWFGESVVAILEVGWERPRRLRDDDARLLDSLGQYLSVQLVGAFAQLRQRRRDSLKASASKVREVLMEAGDGSDDDIASRLARAATIVAEELGSRLARLVAGPGGLLRASSALGDDGSKGASLHDVPFSLASLEEGVDASEGAVLLVSPTEGLGAWLRTQGLPCRGALVDLGELAGERRVMLFLRAEDEEPLDASEQAFLRGFVEDVRAVARGEAARRSDKHIAQALQQGMRNTLQDVRGVTAEASYTSATASALVGGDFYDLVRLPGRRACVIMGDVSGKGVEAASVSAAAKTALRAYAGEGLSPAAMVRNLNDFLLGFSRPETFVTLFVGVFDLADGTLAFCSAGHPPALLVRAASGEIEQLSVQSGVVGALPDMTYRDGHVTLGAGDVLVLYTDGTTEARSPEGAFFGEEGLRSLLAREMRVGFDGLVERILSALYGYTGGHLVDDVALVALRFDEVGEGRPEAAS